jgi:hypothetical protein
VQVAYDEKLADRVSAILEELPGDDVTERKMFGGLAFMYRGHMVVGIVGEELMVRAGPEATEAALRRPHVREMDFTGRHMKNMVFVEPAGLKGRALRGWVDAGVAFSRTLPPKPGY